MKKFSALLLALLMALLLVACSSGSTSAPSTAEVSVAEAPSADDPFADGPSYNFIVSMNADAGTAIYRTAEYFGQLISERSNGKMQIAIYPSAQLGGITEVQAGIKAGEIDIGVYSLDGSYAPELAVFDLPFTYAMDDTTVQLWSDSAFRDMVDSICESVNIKVLSISPTGYRIAGGQTPVYSMEDFSKWNIRVQENAVQMKIWESLGAKATPLAMGETYVALQQGLVNAFDNVPDAHVATKMYEQEKYIVETDHILFNTSFIINLNTFNSLPAAYQEVLLSCENEVVKYAMKITVEADAACIKTMQDKGLEVITFDADMQKQMFEAVQPAVDIIRETAGDEIVDTALKGLGKM